MTQPQKIYNIPFAFEQKDNLVMVGNRQINGFRVPSYGMLLPGEQAEIDKAELITAQSRDRDVALLARSIYERESLKEGGAVLSFPRIELMIREMQATYTPPALTSELKKLKRSIEAFQKSNPGEDLPIELQEYQDRIDDYYEPDLKLRDGNLKSYRESLADYIDEIYELSKKFAKEDDRRYEVHAVVIARNRLGLEGITYPELCEQLKSYALVLRLGMFGIYEASGLTYDEADFNSNPAPVSEPLTERSEAELAK
jgi:hypothetical protein